MIKSNISKMTVLTILAMLLIAGMIPGISGSYFYGFAEETAVSDKNPDKSSVPIPGGGPIQLLATDEGHDDFFDAEGTTLSFAETESRYIPKQYRVRVLLTNLPTSDPGTVKIELAEGISFVKGTTGENDTTLMAALDPKGINHTNTEILEYINGAYALQKNDVYEAAIEKLKDDTMLTGTIREAMTSLTWEFHVQGNSRLAITDEIQDAIKVTLTRGSDETVVKANAQYTFNIIQSNAGVRSASVSNNAETLIRDYLRYGHCAKMIDDFFSIFGYQTMFKTFL